MEDSKIMESIFLFKNAEKAVEETVFSKPKSYKKGQVIYCRETFENSIGVLLSGKAKATTATNDGLLTRFGKGDVFGVAAVFGAKEEYISTIVAESDCVVQFIEQDVLTMLFEKYPVISVNYIAFLSSKIRFLNEKLSIMMQDRAQARLYEYLLKNDGYSGKMTALANILCMGRTSLYRRVEALEQKQLIVRDDGKIKVIL